MYAAELADDQRQLVEAGEAELRLVAAEDVERAVDNQPRPVEARRQLGETDDVPRGERGCDCGGQRGRRQLDAEQAVHELGDGGVSGEVRAETRAEVRQEVPERQEGRGNCGDRHTRSRRKH